MIKHDSFFRGLLCLLLTVCLSFFAAGVCRAETARAVETAVKMSLETQQESQKLLDAWEKEKSVLAAEYSRLQKENEALSQKQAELQIENTAVQKRVDALVRQKFESLRIQKEMLPFLKQVQQSLVSIIGETPLFLAQERLSRIEQLDSLMVRPDVSVAEKYRKIMEALFIEAEYGNTIEVYQEKISLDGDAVLGDIFRLGRVSLFFLSLDRSKAAVFDVADEQWRRLPPDHVGPVRTAVEIGQKQRPVELISLPIGRIAADRGDS